MELSPRMARSLRERLENIRWMSWPLSLPRIEVTTALLWGMMALYIGFFAWLSLEQHDTLRTNALDLGYYDQALWNTLHGRLFQFSLLEDAEFRFSGQSPTQKTTSLLGFHAEPILVPLSLLYLFTDVRGLLVLQTVALALGALPVYWLAREHLKHDIVAFVLAATYLLSPSLEAANLSDFHPLSLAAPALLFAFYAAHRGHTLGTIVAAVAAVATREDVALPMAIFGLWLLLWRRQRALGGFLAFGSLLWFVVAVFLITPRFNELGVDPFLRRYADLGDSPQALIQTLFTNPQLYWQKLTRPAVLEYLFGLFLNTGFLSLFYLPTLAMALPTLAMNALSNFPWQYSGGGHYSVIIVPIFTVAAIFGLGFVARRLAPLLQIEWRSVLYFFAGMTLLFSYFQNYREGISPVSRNFAPPQATTHDRLFSRFLAQVPATASLSAQSVLVPHLSRRERIYIFPTVKDADYIFLDVTTTPFPTSHWDLQVIVQNLLGGGQYGVLDAADGYLLLKRGLQGAATIPKEFYTFARGTPAEIQYPLFANFDNSLQLLGYSINTRTEVNQLTQQVKVATFWRWLKPQETPKDFVFVVREGPKVMGFHRRHTAASIWYPTTVWRWGEIVRVETSRIHLSPEAEVLVGVVPRAAPDWSVPYRLAPIVSPQGEALPLFDNNTLLLLSHPANDPNTEGLAGSLPELPPLPTPIVREQTSTPKPTPQPTLAPLLGLPVENPDLLARRPLAVKIDNAPPARPQSGLSRADVVYEHLVEWGITRFMALFQRGDADPVGPVRSGRLVDVELAAQFQAMFVHFGASPPIMERFRTDIAFDLDMYWDGSLYYRSRDRVAPYNAYSSTAHLRQRGRERGWTDRAELRGFVFDSKGKGLPEGNPASYLLIPYPHSSRVEYRWDGAKGFYRRFQAGEPHIDALTKEQIGVDNVVVQYVESRETDIIEDAGGARSLEIDLLGEGKAEVFRDGKHYSARWVRKAQDQITQFLTVEGKPLPFKPGNTWISLVPKVMEASWE